MEEQELESVSVPVGSWPCPSGNRVEVALAWQGPVIHVFNTWTDLPSPEDWTFFKKYVLPQALTCAQGCPDGAES